MNLLALDQAAECGWAAWVGDQYLHGVWRYPLRKYPNAGMKWAAFMRDLIALHERHRFSYIAMESQHVGKFAGAARATHGMMAIVELWCDASALPKPVEFTPAQWRSKMYGSDKVFAPKGMPADEVKAWHTEHAFEFCADLGLDVVDGNEAEAVVILEALRAELSPDVAAEARTRVTGQREMLV